MTNEIVILIVIFVFVAIYSRGVARRKKKTEDELLKSINRNKRIARPKMKNADGTKKSPEVRAAELAHYNNELRQKSIKLAKANKIEAQRMGSKAFIWRSAEDGDECPECMKNNGKTFRWDKPPKGGLPGEGNCCPDGLCRCYPEEKF